jgi:hypothetical protein
MSNKKTTTLIIHENITNIKKNQFKNFKYLMCIKIPIHITTIEDGAFSGCKSLTKIDIPPNVIFIGNNAFKDCSSLTKIIIPPSVIHIGIAAFEGCSSLKSIIMSPHITKLCMNTFSGCISLKYIKLPESLIYIGPYAFSFCEKLEQVDIPNTVIKTGAYIFNNCKLLNQIVLPPSIIKGELLLRWSCLTSLIIETPFIINEIEGIFNDMYINLNKISAPDKIIKQLQGPFSKYNKLSEVPLEMRAVPHADTWEKVLLWKNWSDLKTDSANGRNIIYDTRYLSFFTILLTTYKITKLGTFPEIPIEILLLIFTFLKS